MGIIVIKITKMTNSSYLCFSTPDHVKNDRACDSDDDCNDNESSHKEVDRGFTPGVSAAKADSTSWQHLVASCLPMP